MINSQQNKIWGKFQVPTILNTKFFQRLILILVTFTFWTLLLAVSLQDVYGQNTSVVTCGNGRNVGDACTIDKLFGTLNQFAGVLIKVVFPAVFFFGLFMTVTPILWSADKPEALALAKSRFKYVAIGSGVVLGAYLIVKVVLTSLGFKEADTVQPTFSSYINIFVESAYAQNSTTDNCTSSICNPLSIGSVQDVIRSVANTVAFLAIVGSVIAIVRGVIFLMLSQENPDFVKRGKKWIIGGLGVATLFLGGELIYTLIVNTAKSVAG